MTDTTQAMAMALLTVSPSLEEAMVDALLRRAEGRGFTSFPVSGHGSDHARLSLAEQVSGRRRQIRFQVEMGAHEVPEFHDWLHRQFPEAAIHCVFLPLLVPESRQADSVQRGSASRE